MCEISNEIRELSGRRFNAATEFANEPVQQQVLSNDVPRKSGESLGKQLAPPLFQTLIVTWIKANLHATICVDLWNGFVRVLSTLSHWEPLIDEWAVSIKAYEFPMLATNTFLRSEYSRSLERNPEISTRFLFGACRKP